MDKLQILTDALKAREKEVMHYQIDIDNYERAILSIDSKYQNEPSLAAFRAQLADLLASSRLEQLKAIIIRDVIADQIAELEAS
jgi:hypothetical protein